MGLDTPPDQKSFQMLSIWLRISPTYMHVLKMVGDMPLALK
jgi:hypothetical protein